MMSVTTRQASGGLPGGAAVEDRPIQAPTRVVIVDDHQAFAECLAMAIALQPDLECSGLATSIAEGVTLTERVAPDIILLDVNLPDGHGVDAIPRFRTACPEAQIVILTGHMDVDVLTRSASAGAAGFLQKESPLDVIMRTVRSARDGSILVEQSTLASILGYLRDPASNTRRRGSGGDPGLTAREHDVIDLMGQGLDPHTIAGLLEISLNTCRGYEKSIMAKLDAHSQLEAVVIATRRGIIRQVQPV